MKRRTFIKLTSTASALTMLPFDVFSLLKTSGMIECPDLNKKKIVLIQLAGANDGLNTIVPINQYDLYANLRPNLKLNLNGQNGIINLDTSLSIENQIGLHPSLSGFKSLYESGFMRIIQGVSYTNSNKSHFKSTDLWNSGGDGTFANFSFQSGWLGRFMENFYSNYINADYPLGIQLGSGDNSLIFQGETHKNLSLNINNQDVSGYYSVINGLGSNPPNLIPNSEYGNLIQYISDVDASANIYGQKISDAFNNGSNSIPYPDTSLSNQLKTVAKFISGKLETKIYLVKLAGFDTHDMQILSNTESHLGNHAVLLQELSEAVNSFITDLNNQNIGDDVLTFTFSEFGRKIAENANLGTDHGEVAPLFLFGKNVNPGISGTNINLSEATEENNFQILTQQFDYRSIFATVLQDWLGSSNTTLDISLFNYTTNNGFSNTKLSGIFNQSSVINPECYTSQLNPFEEVNNPYVSVFPNPSSDTVTISAPDNEIIFVTLFSMDGKLIYSQANPDLTTSIQISIQYLSAGIYVFEIETKKGKFNKKIIVRR